MRTKKSVVRCLVACAALGLTVSTVLAGDNWVGTWKFNPAKSKVGSPVRAQTLTFEAGSDGITVNGKGTDPQGQPVDARFTSKFDGTDVRWSGMALADTASPKRIDDNSYENEWKKDGKVVMRSKAVVSKDGRTLTITQTPAEASAGAGSSVLVYDRQ